VVAREVELTRVRDAVRRGPGVVIAGAAGVGKTALAAAAVAEADGRAVYWLAATEASRLTPFGVLGPLLPAELGALHPALVPGLVADRLRGGAARPALLVVDDAQLLDDRSAAAVLAVVTSGAAGLVVTLRTGVTVSDAVTALWKDLQLDRLDLDTLDRTGAAALLADRLGGEVATGTVELLWQRSQGNALYLTELARFGVDTGRLRHEAGMWWWSGRTELPPRLVELLRSRLDDVSPAAREARDVLALGEPLPWDTFAAVVGTEAILELDDRGLLASDDHDGVLRLRFAHPLLHAVAAGGVSPARRRALATRLRAAPAGHVDLVRRAIWEESVGEPDVEVLLAAADSVMLSDPATAARFAERAARHDDHPRAAVALSAAHAELGDLPAARTALLRAADQVRDDEGRLAVGFEAISLALWTARDPDAAHVALANLAARLGPGPADTADHPADRTADHLDTAAALVLLFTGRPIEALHAADAVLARDPAPDPLIRALTVRVGALAVAGRPAAAETAAARLLDALRAAAMPATRAGLAHALIAQARVMAGYDVELPRSSGSGRWPLPVTTGPAPVWPLPLGQRLLLRGDHAAAVTPLREAYLQQRSGEGLFRSEVTAALIVALAESDRPDEAAALLAEQPPDRVAVFPGLRCSAEAAVAAAAGRRTRAVELAMAAATEAAAVGAVFLAVQHLADAARYGGPTAARAAVAVLDELPDAGPLAAARAAGVRARAAGDPAVLLAAAEQHAALGLHGHAAELAELARSRDPGRTGPSGRAAALAGRARAGLGRTDPPAGLTRRELEIARMAADGLSDKDIAGTLVVSVRTVGTHLATTYRKLGIRSRRELSAALTSARPAPAGPR
jgi:DNA-binding NarL/FixJ family response regulator